MPRPHEKNYRLCIYVAFDEQGRLMKDEALKDFRERLDNYEQDVSEAETKNKGLRQVDLFEKGSW